MRIIKFSLVIASLSFGLVSPAWAKLSILQGSTSESITHFTVVVPVDRDYHYVAVDPADGREVAPLLTEKNSMAGSDWAVQRLRFEGLRAGVTFLLRALDPAGAVIDERRFRMLDPQAHEGRIGLVSCMLTQLHNPGLWSSLALPANRPDLLLILGDAVYLDRASLAIKKFPTTELEVWKGFATSRNTLGLYFWDDLVSVLSVWDDHDSAGDGADGNSRILPTVRSVYDLFFANEEIAGSLTRGPGLAKQFRIFGKNVIMLDGRSYRSLDANSPMLGQEQEDWMIAQVQPGPNFIMNGIQFYGGFIKKDSLEYNWPNYEPVFSDRIRQVSVLKNAQIAFASGDVHFSEIQAIEPSKIGYPTFEITSSSAHSFAAPGHQLLKPNNPRRLEVTGSHNAVLLELNDWKPGFNMGVRSLGWRGDTLFEQLLEITPMPTAVNRCEKPAAG